MPLVGRRDAEVDEARRDDREGHRARQQEIDRRRVARRQDAERREEDEDDHRDHDRDEDVLAPARGQAQLHPPSGCKPRCGRGRRRATRWLRRGTAAHERRVGVLADEREIRLLERPPGGPHLDDEPVGRSTPCRERGDERGVRRRRPRSGSRPPSGSVDEPRAGSRDRERHAAALGLGWRERAVQTEPECRRNPGAQLGRSPGGDDPAAIQDADPIGQPLDVREVVARQQDRRPRGAKVGDDRPGRRPGLGVHPGGRLVEDDDLGPPDERERETEPLTLTSRQPSVASPGDRPKTDEVDQLIGIPRVSMEAAVLAERLERLGSRVDAAVLEHQARPATARAGPPVAGSMPRTLTRPPSPRR